MQTVELVTQNWGYISCDDRRKQLFTIFINDQSAAKST